MAPLTVVKVLWAECPLIVMATSATLSGVRGKVYRDYRCRNLIGAETGPNNVTGGTVELRSANVFLMTEICRVRLHPARSFLQTAREMAGVA